MRRRPSRSHGLLASSLTLLMMAGCRPSGSAAVDPSAKAVKAPDPTAQGDGEEEPVANYPDRATPYDRYLESAHMRVALRVQDPASMSKMWSAFSRAYGVASLDFNVLARESLYSAGVPGEVLDVVDPSQSWAAEIDYPMRAFTGKNWLFVPALPDKAKQLAEAIATWLDMQEVSEGFWHAPPVEVADADPDIAYQTLPADQKGEGSYLGLQGGGVVLGFREAAVKTDHKPAPDAANTLALLEIEGFATVVPDLLEEFDITLHGAEREESAKEMAALDRVYLRVDKVVAGPKLDIEVGVEGDLAAFDPGMAGPARTKPAEVAKLLPRGAFMGATLSWGDPTFLGKTLRAGTRGPGSAALEREFGDWSDDLVDQVVGDAGLAIYVDDRGRHTLVVALPGLSPRDMKASAETLMKLCESALRSLEAGLVAKEAAREISKEAYEAQRLPYQLVDYKRRGGKVKAMEVTLTESLRDTVKFLADDEGKFVFSAFEYKSAFVFAMGPGTQGFLSSLGRSSMAKEPGLQAAHERSGGCQVCAFIDGSRGAASTYGRHRRGMTEERRKEAEKLLPKLRQGEQSPVYLRVEPGALRASYLLDMSVIEAGKKREELWESFMKAIGARGESVSDPREWLFG